LQSKGPGIVLAQKAGKNSNNQNCYTSETVTTPKRQQTQTGQLQKDNTHQRQIGRGGFLTV